MSGVLTDKDGTPYPEGVQEAHSLAVQVVISDLLVAQLRDEERIAAEAEKRGAVKALRAFAARFNWDNDPASYVLAAFVSQHLTDRAEEIETGQVTV